MREFDEHTLIPVACNKIVLAAKAGKWNGRSFTPYFESCRWLFRHYNLTVVYTKEDVYHTGGWCKNPEYERCWHLSVSFQGGEPDKRVLKLILECIFGVNQRLLWVESPYSQVGKNLEVTHYRLFCDEHWKPIQPKGEVYNTHFTERGWKSFSELNTK